MKTNNTLRAALALAAASLFAAGAMAQADNSFARANSAAVAATPMSTTGLYATPASLAFSIGGGLTQVKTVTITNGGPGFASNLSVTLAGNGGQPHDYVYANSDTCTGATLAVGGTCTVRVGFDSQCPKAWYSTWNLHIGATGTAAVDVPITATSKGGTCQ
jgi:hypothetical protein